MRLIDADALKECFTDEGGKGAWTYHVVVNAVIDSMFTIDAVSVVRCKECDAYMTDGYAEGCGFCSYHQSVVKADDFCSYGERREP